MAIASDRARIAARCAVLGLIAVAESAGAGEWRFTPGVSAGQTYSDNIEQAPPGDERHEFVTQVRPNFQLRGQGGRVSLDLIYSLQALRRARASELNVNHQLQARGDAELVERIVFLDVAASRSQANVTNTGTVAADNITESNNRTDVTTYSVSPYVRHRFGSWADSLARWTFSGVDSGGAAGGSTGTSVELQLSSGAEFTRLPWSVSASRREQESDAGVTSRFQSASASVQYRWTRKFTSTFSAGIEKNDFQTAGNDDTNGPTWTIGGIWTPTPRTSVNAGLSHRFFGESIYLDVQHRTRKAIFTAGLSEDTTTSSQLALERELVPLVDAFGEPIENPDTGQAVLIPIDRPTLTDQVIVQRRFDASMTIQGLRTSATVSVFTDRRDFQLSGADETVSGVSLSASRTLSRRTTVSVGGNYQVSEPAGGIDESVRYGASVNLIHTISRSLSGTLSVSHAAQDSDTPANEFEENRVQLNVSMSF